LFVTDDLTTFIGRIIGVPSIFITDDDLSAVPESWILMITANHIFSPEICDLGKYNSKKIGYLGYKCLAHLHPNHFTSSIDYIDESYKNEPYFFIRTVSATSTHDLGRKGLTDDTIRKIIDILKNHGKIILNSERKLPEDLQKYVYNFNKNDVAHYLYHAKIFISDSTTMCAEAGILGTPSLEVNDWHTDFKQYQELYDYGLLQGFYTNQINKLLETIQQILSNNNSKRIQLDNKNKMLKEKIDVSQFLAWICKDYPNSSTQYFKDKSIIQKFK
jgi:predicted glycosyltransferase